jgi:hypothetical protein
MEVIAVDDQVGVVQGEVDYANPDDDDFVNLWVVRFGDDGRCTEFTEWWITR